MSEATDYQQTSPSMLGTWEYLLDDREGLCITTKTHISWILVDKGRKPFQHNPPTEAEQVRAFSESFADVSTYTFTGPSRVAVHKLYSTHPGSPDFTFEYEIEGDLCKYWVLQPDGSRGDTQLSRRVKV